MLKQSPFEFGALFTAILAASALAVIVPHEGDKGFYNSISLASNFLSPCESELTPQKAIACATRQRLPQIDEAAQWNQALVPPTNSVDSSKLDQ